MTSAVLIVAAGRGSRTGGPRPKQYATAGDRPVLAHTVRAFADHAGMAPIRVVIHHDDAELYRQSVVGIAGLADPVFGGETRQQSVLNGLESLAEYAPERVLIHDAARPFVDSATIVRVDRLLDSHDGAIPAIPVSDTLTRVDDGRIGDTVDRAGLCAVQTPQGFRFGAILDAHRRAAAAGRFDFTDDASVARWAGMSVAVAEGNVANRKITTPEDLDDARRVFAAHRLLVPRVGNGFDVHAFEPGDHVMLCGVRVPHVMGLKGHSDADVALHALTDAILGAACDGDIGRHFPPSDERWRGASSDLFLRSAAERVGARGGHVGHADVTIVCEAPKIGPHAEAMRNRIAEILGVRTGQVSVKATTSEGLGFTGRREGIAAYATATVFLPADE